MIQLSFVAKYCSDAEHTVDAEQCWCWALLWCWAVWALMLDAAWRPHPLPLIPTHPASSYTCTFVNEIFERSVVNIMIYIVSRIFVTSWSPNRVKGFFSSLDHLFCVDCRKSIIAPSCPASFLCNNIYILYLMLYLRSHMDENRGVSDENVAEMSLWLPPTRSSWKWWLSRN